MPLPEPLRPLETPAFRLYLAGQAVSLVGTWMQQMAQGWVVTRLTSSASMVGTLALATALPMALFGLKGGQTADRFSRRRILLVTQSTMAVLALGLGLLAYSGALGLVHVFVFATLLGLAGAFDLPAAQSFAPELVPKDQIPRAVALVQAIFHGSRLIGPALAGLAIDRFGEGSAFMANAASFLFVIACLVAIAPSAGAPAARRAATEGGAGEGFRQLRRDPVLAKLFFLVLACMSLSFPFIIALLPFYARYVVGADASGMGTLMSTSGLGALSGTIVLVLAGGRAWRTRIGLGAVIVPLALAGLAMQRALGSALPLLLALTFGTSLFMGTISQTVQLRVPNEVRGRVMALFTVGMTVLMPTSSFLLSLGAERAGLPALMTGAGVVFGVVSLSVLFTLPRERHG